MKKDNHSKTQNQGHSTSVIFSKSLLTGFIGGILWSGFGVIMYYFKFSEVGPNSFLLRSWLTADWTNGWLGDVFSIILAGILSLLTAIIYYALFKKFNSMWIGALYGAVLWGIIFIVLHPLFPHVPEITNLEWKTIISTICLFLLYGAFIGYSISFDYHNMKVMKKHQMQARS